MKIIFYHFSALILQWWKRKQEKPILIAECLAIMPISKSWVQDCEYWNKRTRRHTEPRSIARTVTISIQAQKIKLTLHLDIFLAFLSITNPSDFRFSVRNADIIACYYSHDKNIDSREWRKVDRLYWLQLAINAICKNQQWNKLLNDW